MAIEIICNIIILFCATYLLYVRAMKYGYVSDDLLSEGRRKAVPSQVALDERVWKSSTSGNTKLDHGISILVHAGCSVMIYVALGLNPIALAAALLFCANPINNQGAVWISGRHYSWCGLFLLMAMSLKWFGFPAMILATVHPTALFAPLGYLGSNQWYLICFLPLIWIFHYRSFKREIKARRGQETVDYDRKFSGAKIIIAIKTYGWYFSLCCIPWAMTWYHNFMQSGAGAGNELMAKRSRKLDFFFWVGIALIAFLIYSAIWNWTAVAWGLWWYSCAIAPYLNLFRMQQEIAERYVYVANIGVMFALANLLPLPILLVLFGFYIARLWTYLPAYTDDYWLIERGINEDPSAWYCWFIRGHKRWQQQAIREALNCWVMAKMLSPHEFKILYNLAIVLKYLKQDAESLKFMDEAKAHVIKGQEKTAEHLFKEYAEGRYQLLR